VYYVLLPPYFYIFLAQFPELIIHDAGYLLLDQNKLQRILSKPEITDEEWKFIQSHVENGIEYFHGATLPPFVMPFFITMNETMEAVTPAV
jgi:hypothetical protein